MLLGSGFYEFFCGGGMARLGLGPHWHCLFANDIDKKKGAVYRSNFAPGTELLLADISHIAPSAIPDGGFLAWASFPCQDLSLAGKGGGLRASRSGTFWHFMRLITQRRPPPPLIVLENVVGLLSAQNGGDFAELVAALTAADYKVGAILGDAAWFVPQSRPRLLIIAVHHACHIPAHLVRHFPDDIWHPDPILRAYCALKRDQQNHWIWWEIPRVPKRTLQLYDLIDIDSSEWDSREQTNTLLNAMSPSHYSQIDRFRKSDSMHFGSLFKRTRQVGGKKAVRAEIRFDGVAGCLRTPAGGSSRQTLIIVGQGQVRTRLFSAREAARLMGIPDAYTLPDSLNEALHLVGDGVVVPVVKWISDHLLIQILRANSVNTSVA